MSRTSSEKRPPEDRLRAAVEAVVFAAAEPVKPKEIARAFGRIEESLVVEALEALDAEYVRRDAGIRIERIAGGYRVATRPEVGSWVRQFFRERNRTRLTPAALETLAIVGYRQPVTGPEIQSIRGVDPSGALRSLLDKKMIRILGKKKVVGSPLLYGTTKQFLVHFGLDSLEDLPAIEDFEEFVGAFGQDPLFPAGEGEEAPAEESPTPAPVPVGEDEA